LYLKALLLNSAGWTGGIHRNFSKDNRVMGQDSNLIPPKFSSGPYVCANSFGLSSRDLEG